MELVESRSVRTNAMPHVMLLDLYATGHHPQYILNLVEYWAENSVTCRLTIVAPDELRKASNSLDMLLREYKDRGLSYVSIDQLTPSASSTVGLVKADQAHGRLLRHHIDKHRPDHVALMYFDHCQLSLAFGLRLPQAVSFSGIYFRPTFHLDERPGDLRSRLTDLRKKAVLRHALRNPHFRHLFCLDPFVVPTLAQMAPDVKSVHLPDGVRVGAGLTPCSDVRAEWAIEEGRVVALLLGVLDARKGVHIVLEAVRRLEREAQRKLTLVFAGPVKTADESVLREAIAEVCERTEVHVLLDNRYVPDSEVQSLVEASDVVLLPYQRDHVGSSNMLARAAIAGVPVLGTDHGLIGKLIIRHRLGDTMDSTDPDGIALSLRQLVQDGDQIPFDQLEAREYGRSHSATRMGEVFFSNILRDL